MLLVGHSEQILYSASLTYALDRYGISTYSPYRDDLYSDPARIRRPVRHVAKSSTMLRRSSKEYIEKSYTMQPFGATLTEKLGPLDSVRAGCLVALLKCSRH